ncbi:uncharacterized protein LOC120108058 [Phoenix dactylifera]|uniref:Uncharacterized protein LOC120108058 n=1 Tax=Phoenix dactylifera TaxID=42345 RepID=A0A8B9A139_PHODC|nr:uncharacterized protein LOC120108058 [Phoenix dactylifera]
MEYAVEGNEEEIQHPVAVHEHDSAAGNSATTEIPANSAALPTTTQAEVFLQTWANYHQDIEAHEAQVAAKKSVGDNSKTEAPTTLNRANLLDQDSKEEAAATLEVDSSKLTSPKGVQVSLFEDDNKERHAKKVCSQPNEVKASNKKEDAAAQLATASLEEAKQYEMAVAGGSNWGITGDMEDHIGATLSSSKLLTYDHGYKTNLLEKILTPQQQKIRELLQWFEFKLVYLPRGGMEEAKESDDGALKGAKSMMKGTTHEARWRDVQMINMEYEPFDNHHGIDRLEHIIQEELPLCSRKDWRKRKRWQVLIHWKRRPREGGSWEPYWRWPIIILEVKEIFQGGGNVADPSLPHRQDVNRGRLRALMVPKEGQTMAKVLCSPVHDKVWHRLAKAWPRLAGRARARALGAPRGRVGWRPRAGWCVGVRPCWCVRLWPGCCSGRAQGPARVVSWPRVAVAGRALLQWAQNLAQALG